MSTQQHNLPLLCEYIAAGFALVPLNQGKKPTGIDWNQSRSCVTTIDKLDPHTGYGIAHAYCTPTTCAIDVDAWSDSVEWLRREGIDLKALALSSDAVMIASGVEGHAKLLYRMPFGLTLPSKKFMRDGRTIFELRCATASGLTVQDVLPSAALHPSTGEPYRWVGTGHFSNLPIVPAQVLEFWNSSLTVVTPSPVTNPLPADWVVVRSALTAVSPDCPRQVWIEIGMALHHQATQQGCLPEGFALWVEWSKPSSKYPGDKEIESQWNSFKTSKGSPIQVGSLYHHAIEAGWSHPKQDVSTMFKDLTVAPVAANLKKMFRPSVPRLNFELVPSVLANRAKEVGENIGGSPEVAVLAGLAALCAVADSRSTLKINDGFEEPLILWCMTIASPGSKKTPISDTMVRPLREIEMLMGEGHAEKLAAWKIKSKMHKVEEDAQTKIIANPDTLIDQSIIPAIKPLEAAPESPSVFMNDITSQSMVRVCSNSPRGVLVYMDEGRQWLKEMTKTTTTENRSTWTQAYSGSPLKFNRVSSPSIICNNLSVSMYANVQPDVIGELRNQLGTDGLLQRFIFVNSDEYKMTSGKLRNSTDTYKNSWGLCLKIASAIDQRAYTMSAEAFNAYELAVNEWVAHCNDLNDLGVSGAYISAVSKSPAFIARIALAFHLLESPYIGEVSADTMLKAIQFHKSFIIPGQEMVYCEDGGKHAQLERWLVDYVVSHSDKQKLTLTDMKKAVRRVAKFDWFDTMTSFQSSEFLSECMMTIEGLGWVVREDQPTGNNKSATCWYVNPAVAELYATEILEMTEKRKRITQGKYKA
jgi:hypothetical protein